MRLVRSIAVVATTGLLAGTLSTLPRARAATPKCFGEVATIVGTKASEDVKGTTGDDVIVGLAGADVIRGRGGNDLICGGDGNDELLGQAGDDKLNGDAGKDVVKGGVGASSFLVGGAGNDDLVGTDASNDVASFATAPKAVTVDLGAENAKGWGSDSLSEIDEVIGSVFDDTLTGGDGGDTLHGGEGNDALFGAGGNDVLKGGEGDDSFDGGEGNLDTANFAGAPGAVTVNLATGTATGWGSDTLTAIQGVIGSDFDDVLTGDPEQNTFDGRGGNDMITGGGGQDTASFATAPGIVVVDLGAGTATGDGTDTLAAISSIIGSGFDDSLTGSASVNDIAAGPGNDAISGLGGNDRLDGGNGTDTLDGGEGNDVCRNGETVTNCES
ncbi:MAG: calcium-binding protein [Actinomycetota bacterium]